MRPSLTGSAARILALALLYGAVVTLSLAAALLLRFDLRVPGDFWERFWLNLPWIVALKLLLLAVFGQFRSLLTYFSLPDAKMIAMAMGSAAVIEMGVWFAFSGVGVVPRGTIVSDAILSFVGLCATRTGLRLYRERFLAGASVPLALRKRVAIVGAGQAAADLLRDIHSRPALGLDVVCLLSDDKSKIGGTMHGKPVLGPISHLPQIAKAVGLQKVILAMSDAKPAFVAGLIKEVNSLGLDHDVLPTVAQLVHRRVSVSHLRHVEPSDLLGRDEIKLDEAGISNMLRDKVVLVTGAGGSIGSELCRQVAELAPASLLLVDRSEPALFAIEQELKRLNPDCKLVPRVYDVCNAEQMERFMASHKPAFIFQAAAHKHVPLMEEQPEEALRNNVFGTALVARLAAQHAAEKFVLVSSDKAASPCNVMGASKRLAEMVVEEIHASSQRACAFCAVRFGNVLGSSGSVVPIFRRQIADGGPVTVTHSDATRFFMSLPEAVGLILQSAMMAEGGETFVLDMGAAIRIDDLARQMIELSGLVPGEDIQIIYTGLRPGERLHEEPVHLSADVVGTRHPKVRSLRRQGPEPGRDLVSALVSQHRLFAHDETLLRGMLFSSLRA